MSSTRDAWKSHPASDKQLTAIRRELARRQLSADVRAAFPGSDPVATFDALQRDARAAGRDIRKGWASALLDALFALPYAPRETSASPVTKVGFYTHGGDVYRVVRTRDGARMYAKKLQLGPQYTRGFSWEYAPGAFAVISADSRLTPEQAAEFGKLHNRCAYCGTPLEDAISQAFYMGPSCSERHAGIKRSRSRAAYAEAEAILAARKLAAESAGTESAA